MAVVHAILCMLHASSESHVTWQGSPGGQVMGVAHGWVRSHRMLQVVPVQVVQAAGHVKGAPSGASELASTAAP